MPEITEDEIPFDIPDSWKWVRFNSVISLLSGADLTAEQCNNLGNGIPYIIGASNIEKHRVAITRWTEHPNNIANQGDLLLTCKGTVGKTAILTEYQAHIARQIMAITPIIVDTIFIQYFIENQVDYLKSKAKSMVPGIERANVLKLLFPLPPLAEQRRIVAKIEELSPYLDRYAAAWERLEAFNQRFPSDMRKSLLQMAIQGKLVEQRPEEGTGEELYRQIQAEKQRLIKSRKLKKEKPLPEIADDEIPFEIPDSWKWASIGAVCVNIQYGTSKKSSVSGKVAVLRMGNLREGQVEYTNLAYTSDEADILRYSLNKNDLLFNRTNSKELVGKTAIYKAEIPAIYAGYLIRVTPVFVDGDYLNYVMQSYYFWDYCQRVKSDAIGQSNINAEKLKAFYFPLPPFAEQKRIVARLEELLPLCVSLK